MRLVRLQQFSELLREDEVVFRKFQPSHVLVDVAEHQFDVGDQRLIIRIRARGGLRRAQSSRAGGLSVCQCDLAGD